MRAAMSSRVCSAVTALSLVSIYVGAYCLLVDPIWLLNPVPGRPAVVADYEVGGSFAKWFFLPMNVIDRRVRPEWWAGLPATPPWAQTK